MLGFLNSFLLLQGNAQSLREVQALQTLMKEEQPKEVFEVAKGNKNEMEMIFSGLFLGYKKFISSQDGNNCVFTPSCSEYALMSIKKHGLIFGTANTFDRLSRCHGLSPEKYQRSAESGLMIDELE
ncbi:MAG: membrane protein insertion efficiency factor YidD [Cyclobacteriaceae bacterium]